MMTTTAVYHSDSLAGWVRARRGCAHVRLVMVWLGFARGFRPLWCARWYCDLQRMEHERLRWGGEGV